MSAADTPTPALVDDLPGVSRFREHAVEHMAELGTMQAADDVSHFVDLVVDLIRELDENGTVAVTSGRGRPRGCYAEYPDLWVNLKLEQTQATRSLDAVNDPIVEIDRLEHHTIDVDDAGEGTFRRSFTDLRLVPALDTGCSA